MNFPQAILAESKMVRIKDVLNGNFPSEMPSWFKDLFEGRKCNWVPDSKGGEPNCKSED